MEYWKLCYMLMQHTSWSKHSHHQIHKYKTSKYTFCSSFGFFLPFFIQCFGPFPILFLSLFGAVFSFLFSFIYNSIEYRFFNGSASDSRL